MMELPPIHHGGHPQMVASVASIVNGQDIVGPQGPLDEVFSLEQVVMESRQINESLQANAAQTIEAMEEALHGSQGILTAELADALGKKKKV